MRSNDDRISVPDTGDSPITSNPNAELNFTTPTEFVSLPSRGTFYPEGHPLKDKEAIEIKFMTAKEEDILTSKSLIRKGLAIDRMLQSLILDKNIKVEEMLIGDKNALTIAARISGYGSDYEIALNCPSCEEKTKQSFDLSLIEHKELQAIEELPLNSHNNGLFTAELIKTNAEVTFRLLTGKDEAEIVKNLSNKTVVNEENGSTSQLRRMIVAVNGNTDKKVINSLIENLPVIDAKLLRSLLKKVTPDVDMSQEFSCPNCGHEEEVEIPFTVEFFWPK